jgi:hypothetical protein
MMKILLLLNALVLGAFAQLIVQPAAQHQSLEHPAVIESQIWESQLHPGLLKSSRFYSDPKTAARLAQESWFTDKEHPVFEREADKIERNQITKIFANSGLHRRRRQA